MADQVSSKVAELSWAIGKFVLKASGSDLLADAGETAGKAYKLVRSLIENSGSDVNNDVAEQINKVLTSKIRSMYGRPAVNKELLEVAATEVKLLLDQITDDDKLLVVAVKNPDSFSDLLRKLAYARQLDIEQEAEPYFRELVDVVKEQYVKVAPRSSEFDKAALKDLFASNEQALTKINQVYELLEDTNKEVKNSNAKLDDFKEDMDALLKRGDAEVARNVSVQKPLIFGRRPYVVESYYIKREEQVRLRNLINEDPRLRVVLVGMRGCGKSQLASDLAQWCEKQKWSLVAWINATSKEQVQSGLIELADRLGIETQGRNEESIIEQCFSYLESGEPSDRLIVFDNVKDIDDLIKLVPRGDGLRVVVTTTNDCGWKNQSWDSIKVGVFSREDSIKCLLRITDSEDLEAAGAVAQKLGDLPLAIAQAGATACAEDWTLKKYLVRLKRYSISIVIKPVQGDSYTEEVYKALLMAVDAALDKLGGDKREVARRQLGGLAVLAQSGVPTRWIDPSSTDAYSSDLEENVPDNADENAHSALTTLVKMSVVQQSADKTITLLHRLQAQVLRENWGEENTAAHEEAFDAAVEILGRTKYEQLPSNDGDARRREVSDLIAQLSAIAVQDYSRSLFGSEQIRLYLYRAFKYGHDLGIEYKTVELSAAVGVIEDVLGPDHSYTLTVRNDLALAYKSVGRVGEAIDAGEELLLDCQRVLGADHPYTLTVRNNLAGAYYSAGRLAEAIDAWKELLPDCQRVLGPDRPVTLTVRNNLAVAYKSVGRFGEAIELFERVLDERERVLGPDHPDTLTVRNNLALAYYSVGRFGEAIELFERVLDECKRLLGPDHPDTLTVRNNLAGAYKSVGRLAEAIDAWKELLPDCQRVLGPDHPVTLNARNNLAGAYLSVGRFGEAIELYERVLAEQERVLGADHPVTLTVRNNLAGAYYSVGRFGEAIELFERVLAEQERVLGPDHPVTLNARNNLAGAYLSVGRFGEAIELFERVLAEQERVLGADHPVTLTVRNNLAGAYDSAGHLAEAIDAWEELLPDCQRVLGLEHPLTKQVEKNLEAAKREMNPPDAPSPETGEE